MSKISTLILIFALILLGGLAFYGINVFSGIKKEEMKIAKMAACGNLYRYTETLANGATTTYPMEKEYQSCLEK